VESSQIRFVLLRPQYSGNLGAAARALKNFGFTDWVWVSPAAEDLEDARRMAVHAQDVLEGARTVATLDEALEGCVWVVGTSSRKLEGRRRFSPREFAQAALERSPEGRIALVFGDEQSGLSNDELWRCHDLSGIRAHAAQPSLNLSQAVLLYAHELHEAELTQHAPSPAPRARVATDDSLEHVHRALRHWLDKGGFTAGGERHAPRDLFETLRRARLTEKEARLWLAALHVVSDGRR